MLDVGVNLSTMGQVSRLFVLWCLCETAEVLLSHWLFYMLILSGTNISGLFVYVDFSH